MTNVRLFAAAAIALGAAACASAPPAPPPAPVVTWEQKLGWMLSLEDRRILAEPEPAAATPPVPVATPRRGATTPAVPAYAAAPDLLVLARDPEGRVRRRAALAIGRVGLAEGLPALARLLQDAEPEVRAMAAFATGLVAHTDGVAPLTAALTDPAMAVRGRAAEGLGLICLAPANGPAPCEASVASAIADMAQPYIGAATAMQGDTETAATAEADAWRLAAFALVRMRDWNALSRITLADGKPVTTWWPIAYALQRINNAGAVPALGELARTNTAVAAAFAIRGLADHRAAGARPFLISTALDSARDLRVRVAAVRALGRFPGADTSEALLKLLATPKLDDNLRLETVTVIGGLGDKAAMDVLLDLLTDEWPVMRATVIGIIARMDPEGFPIVLSGMQPDPDWTVRAAIARLVASLPAEAARARIVEAWKDPDTRVHGAALSAAGQAGLPEFETWLKEALTRPSGSARSAAVGEIGRRRPSWGAEALRDAYKAWANEPDYSPRSAVLSALAQFGEAAARDTLVAALSDRDWAARRQARTLLARIDPAAAEAGIRPAPNTWPAGVYVHPSVVSPAYSPQVSIDTRHGTIVVELNVVDAPLTVWNFLDYARRGFYSGVPFHRVVPNFVVQAGDPRGDGQGSGRSIRDELHPQPYLRGTVGMALAGPDTGGSQFFIMHSPAPHLDALYTVFGKVISGIDVVDRIRQGDVIERMRVSDGT